MERLDRTRTRLQNQSAAPPHPLAGARRASPASEAARQANDTWFSLWDLAKPVIAQVHGYAIAGATELALACDLVYVAGEVLAVAVRIAGVPSDLTQINKRSVHRAFDVWGARAAIRAGTELQALAAHAESASRFREDALDAVKKASRPL